MKRATAPSYPVSIFVAGDYDKARETCRAFCDQEGLCVTVTSTTYVYTGGEEAGVIVGLINYPRFPAEPSSIELTATLLALELMHKLEQESVSIQTPTETRWVSMRVADVAIALLDAISEPLTLRDSDATATAAPCGDMAVPQDLQARAGTASPDTPNLSPISDHQRRNGT